MDLKNLSKSNYTITDGATSENLNTSALMRIADASEKMASNYTKMETDLAMYKRWYNDKCESVNNRDKSISSLRGQITKLKNKIAEINSAGSNAV